MSWQTTTIRRGANHPLHLILTLATCGLWALVWIPVAIAGRRTVITGVHPLPYPPPVYGYGPVMHPGAPPRPQPPPASETQARAAPAGRQEETAMVSTDPVLDPAPQRRQDEPPAPPPEPQPEPQPEPDDWGPADRGWTA